jgi:uncharacterized integral membrane protein (TIGR00697 family)
MVYVCILYASAIFGGKLVQTSFGVVAAGSITGPFWFIFSDVITEVYGFTLARKIFFNAMLCELFFICITRLLVELPSPEHYAQQAIYDNVTSSLIRIYFCQAIAIFFAWYLNAFFITHWKILLHGKYFTLRSIGASGVGEIVFSIISVSLIMLGSVPQKELFEIVFGSCLLKLMMTILFAYPASFLAIFLKKSENIDAYESINFNPFKRMV